MKKIIVTERQLKMIEEEEGKLNYTPEKIDEFIKEASAHLEKGKQMFESTHNTLMSLAIGEIVDDIERYRKNLENMENQQKFYEAKFEKYYDIVEMYDFMDLPDNVKQLERINNGLDSLQMDIYKLNNAFEEILDSAEKLKELNEELNNGRQDTNEQLLKNLGNKIKSGVQNVTDKVKAGVQNITNKVAPNKEMSVPGNQPSKGRDLDQLKAEWSKVNQDKTNMRGYGEAVSTNLSSVRTAAQINAKGAIMNKIWEKYHTREASFGSTIIDEATGQLENGNYINLVIIEPNNIQIK